MKRTTTERGYGHEHQRARERLRPIVEAGKATCARCGRPIRPGEPWHLDHDDFDRSKYLGPSHEACNTGKLGKPAVDGRGKTATATEGVSTPWRSPDGTPWSRDWGNGIRNRP